MKHLTDEKCPECGHCMELAKGQRSPTSTHLLVCPNCFLRLWKYNEQREGLKQ